MLDRIDSMWRVTRANCLPGSARKKTKNKKRDKQDRKKRGGPLQLRRMSIPITCKNDMLFHVLYGGDAAHIRALIDKSIIDIAREYPTDGVRTALHRIRHSERDSIDKLRICFFMLLSENEAIRKRLSNPRPQRITCVEPVCEHKARLFYDELCDRLLPEFIQNETITLSDFVEQIRDTYITS